MSADPRGALNQLVAALERHLEACSTRRGNDDPAVMAAYDDLSEAFETYDAALYDTYQEMTPLVVYSGPEDDDEDDDEDDGEDFDEDDLDDEDDDDLDLELDGEDDAEDGEDDDTDDDVYSGLDDEEFEETERS